MNVKLLRKVKKHILEEPKRLKMWSWIVLRSKYSRRVERSDSVGGDRPFARCGTAACIAGWACILSKQNPVGVVEIHNAAIELLGLTQVQAHKLFGPLSWPDKFYRTDLDSGSRTAAEVTAARIEHFIKTKGQE